MQHELLIAILAGFGGMIGWGFADFFAKKTVDQIGSVASLVWAHIFGSLILIGAVIFKTLIIRETLILPVDLSSWGFLLFFGILQAVVYLLVYEGFSKGKLAVLNPVFASYSGIAAIFSIVAFGEALSGSLLLALGFVFGGILLLNIDPHASGYKKLNLLRTPGLKEMLLASFLAAFWTITWSKFVEGKDWLSFALFMYLFMTATAIFIAKIQKINLNVGSFGLWKFLILIGLCEVAAYLSISLGFSRTGFISIIALLSGSFSLPTLLLSHFFLKEEITQIQGVRGIVIITRIIILSIY